VLALAFPSDVVLAGPLASNGWPARLLIFWIAIAFVVGELAARRKAPGRPRRTSPPEFGTYVLCASLIVAVAASWLRVVSAEESAGVLRAALVLVPLAIIALGVARSATIDATDRLLALFLGGAALSAVVALVQFGTDFSLVDSLKFTGLTVGEPGGEGTRNEFLRVRGAAAHPIEFSVICAALLPVGVHFARFAGTERARRLALVATGLIAVAIPLAVSRSGVLVALISVLAYAVVLNTRERITGLVLLLIGVLLMRAAVPGLLGAIRSLFLGASRDDSITGRTEDYDVVGALFRESPFLGRGLGTFRPEVYFFLDNQYLMSLVEGGLIALTAVVLWLVLGISGARGAVLRSTADVDRSRAQAVAAALLAIGVSGFFFDLFSFSQVTVLTFLLVGISGALWRRSVVVGRDLLPPAVRLRAAVTLGVRSWRAGRGPDRDGDGPRATSQGTHIDRGAASRS
jgi:O-antigen ligase